MKNPTARFTKGGAGFQFYGLEPVDQRAITVTVAPKSSDGTKTDLADVSITYGTPAEVLRGLSLAIDPGQTQPNVVIQINGSSKLVRVRMLTAWCGKTSRRTSL